MYKNRGGGGEIANCGMHNALPYYIKRARARGGGANMNGENDRIFFMNFEFCLPQITQIYTDSDARGIIHRLNSHRLHGFTQILMREELSAD